MSAPLHTLASKPVLIEAVERALDDAARAEARAEAAEREAAYWKRRAIRTLPDDERVGLESGSLGDLQRVIAILARALSEDLHRKRRAA